MNIGPSPDQFARAYIEAANNIRMAKACYGEVRYERIAPIAAALMRAGRIPNMSARDELFMALALASRMVDLEDEIGGSGNG